MAHGTPDWGVTAGAVTTYQLTDLAELAARLGSIVTFDRRGDVVWFDDFEDGLAKWGSGVSEAGSVVDLAASRARSGMYSARLYPSAGASHYANISHWFTIPVLNPLGVEFSFAGHTNWDRLLLEVLIRTGTHYLHPQVQHADMVDELQYADKSGDFVTLDTGISAPDIDRGWYTLKLVVDPLSNNYVRILLNDQTYDLADVPIQATPHISIPSLSVYIWHYARLAEAYPAWVDDFIYTQNEPT